MKLNTFLWCTLLCTLYYTDIVRSSETENIVKRSVQKKKKPKQTPTAADKYKDDPEKFLENFGYLTELPKGVQRDEASRRRAIRAMQRMYGLKQTGQFNAETIKAVQLPRCGVKDRIPEDEELDPLGPQQYYAPGYKWKKNNLKYKTLNYSPDFDKSKQRKAFEDAFKLWSDVTPLTFKETSGSDQDIEIKFGSYNHGDGYPFDGPGMVLAHAFYPENGDTHFDDSETWSEKGEGTNLMIVAAHEFGHALGLGHSNVRSSLMAPTYTGYVPNYKLDYDDILAIQSLYGSKAPATNAPPKPTTTTQSPRSTTTNGPVSTKKPAKPTTKPQPCTTKFDAIFQARDGRIYVFRNQYVFRLIYWGLEKSIKFPQLIRKHFDRPPINIGAAAYSWRTGHTFFFKGNKVWKYKDSKRVLQKRIKQAGYPTPQAAFVGRNGKIYVIRDDKYYIFDETRMKMENTTGTPIQTLWPGIPNSPEAAIRLSDGYLYFFKGKMYHKFSETYKRVLPGYPKDKAIPWMGPTCSEDGGYENK